MQNMNVFTRDSAHFISCSFFYMAYNILKKKLKLSEKFHVHKYIGGRILGQIILTTQSNFELQEPLP